MITPYWLNINSWSVNENTFLYRRFLDNVQDIIITTEHKYFFNVFYWDELDKLTKSLNKLLDNIDINNFKWEDLLALWLEILRIQDDIKNIVWEFLKWILGAKTSILSINSHTLVTYFKIWELIKSDIWNQFENPVDKAKTILMKLKNEISTMNLSGIKYYWWELMNLWDLIIRATIKA